MLQQLLAAQPIAGILLKDGLDEVFELEGGVVVGGKLHVVGYLPLGNPYDSDEILLQLYVERNVAEIKLVSQHAYRPEVNLLVVALALENLRGGVQGCSADRIPELPALGVDRPPEIAEFDDALSGYQSVHGTARYSMA